MMEIIIRHKSNVYRPVGSDEPVKKEIVHAVIIAVHDGKTETSYSIRQ